MSRHLEFISTIEQDYTIYPDGETFSYGMKKLTQEDLI